MQSLVTLIAIAPPILAIVTSPSFSSAESDFLICLQCFPYLHSICVCVITTASVLLLIFSRIIKLNNSHSAQVSFFKPLFFSNLPIDIKIVLHFSSLLNRFRESRSPHYLRGKLKP